MRDHHGVPIVAVVIVATLVVGLAAALLGLSGRAPGRGLLRAVLALQVLLIAQGVAGLLEVGEGVADPVVFVGYLVLSVLLLPGAFALIAEERTKYGTLVLAAACLVVAVVETRLLATL